MGSNPGRDRVAELIEARRDQQIELLQQLVRIPSVTGSEGAIGEFIMNELTGLGFTCERRDLDPDQTDARFTSTDRANVMASLGGSPAGDPKLLLNGHLDVVDPGDERRWDRPPFGAEIVDGHMWGRGSADMKGGIVAAIFAMLVVADLGLIDGTSCGLALTVGEESGGEGAIALAPQLRGVEGIIVMEPTKLQIAPAHAGALQLRITVPGRSAHACVREAGVSALTNAIGLIAELQRLEDRRNATAKHPLFEAITNKVPCNIGTIHGGTWPSTVPESVVLEGRVGVLPGESAAAIRAELEEVVAALAASDAFLREHPPICEWPGMAFLPAETPIDAPIVIALQQGYETATGAPATLTGMTYGADMSHFVNLAGIPTVLFGAGDISDAHASNEHLDLEQLGVATEVLTHTLLAFAQISPRDGEAA
jgi:acetylornithine deacetylase